MFTNYFDVKIVARGSLSHGMNGMNKNDFFSKTRRIAPKTGRNRLVLTLIVFLQSLVALALPERPLETWFHFRIKKLIPEYPRMWNQMIRFLRHFDRSFQSVKVVSEWWKWFYGVGGCFY